ncbi:MAG: Gfo/Idh/MocA family oxidoreductase [Ignavibacteria bacterium]|nr:Gfo/Idh/MocA family oxidoreductase [Ignavibacteria bacterium]
MPTPLHVAIIGCGSIGEIHSECLKQIPGVRIRTFCDVDEQRARALCGKLDGVEATADPEEVFRDDFIDAVYICTQHDTHGRLAIRAASAGKHVMIEKPLALTVAECYEVGNAVEKSGIILMTGFKMRYYPAVAHVREFIPSPVMTIAQMIDARWPDDFWANDPVKGGGNIVSQGCHTMDLVYYLNRSEPVRVYAEGGNFTHPGLDIVDNIVATIQFANGRVASVAQGDSGQTPFVSKFSFQVTDGVRTAHLRNRLKTATMFDGEKTIQHEDPEEYGFLEENRDFIRSLQNNTEPPISYRDGLRATLLVLKAIESVRSGQPQALEW